MLIGLPTEQLEQDRREPYYREILAESADLFLQERYYEALTQPLESIDDLKKLVFIAAKIKDLKLEPNPIEKAKKEALAQRNAQLMKDLANNLAPK
jgi:hypothetical protein